MVRPPVVHGTRWHRLGEERPVRRARVALAAAGVGLLCALALLPAPGSPQLLPSPRQSLEVTAVVASWWAALVNLLLVAILLLSAGRWAREAPLEPPPPAAAPISRAGWLLLLGAALLAGALRWNLAHSGLAWDEVWTLVHTVNGSGQPSSTEPDRIVFHPAPWRATLWHYKQPTNHPAYSVAARLTSHAWRVATGADRGAFSEFALRLPSFAAALAAVVALGVLVQALGFPRAAPAAALLLAIHPWAIRHGADARGYSFVLLFASAGAWLLLRALRDGRWRSWLACAGAQLALLWTFPLAVYLSLGSFAAAAVVLARRPPPGRAVQLARLAVANALAGMVFLQLAAPLLVQIPTSPNWDRPAWLSKRPARNLWTHVAVGMRDRVPSEATASEPTVGTVAQTRPWFPALVFGVLPGLELAGLALVLRRRGASERAVVLALALSPLLVLVMQATVRVMFVPRFALPALVPFVGGVAIALDGAVGALASTWRAPALAPFGVALGILAYQAAVLPRTLSLLRYPYAATRDTVVFLDSVGAGPKGPALRAGVGRGSGLVRVYDASVPIVASREEIAALVDRARGESRPLYLFFSFESLNRHERGGAFRLLDEPRYFEPVAHLGAIDSGASFHVVRWTGAPIEAIPPPPAGSHRAKPRPGAHASP